VGAVPVPLRPTECGLPVADDVIVTAPVEATAVVGAKVTLIVQLAAAASDAAQLCVGANPLPVVAIELIPSGALPEFVSVIAFAALVVPTVWLPNARLVGASATAGAGAATPLPDSATPCGLPPALDAMLRVAVRVFSAAGVNVTLIEQFVPGVSVVLLQLLGANSAALVPVVVMAPSTRLAVPVLLIETVLAALVMPTVWLPKASVVADNPAAGAGAAAPLPVRPRTLVFGAALWPIVIVALRVPIAVGLKVTSIEHDAAGASEIAAAQVPLRVNSAGFVPPSVTDDRTRLAVPVLVRLADIVPELVCSTWLPKLSVAVESAAPGLGVPAAGFAM
jgi:hypothetical protein